MKKMLMTAAAALALVAAPAKAGPLGGVFVDVDQVFTETTGMFTDLIGTFMPGVTNIRLGLGPVLGTKYEGDGTYRVAVAPVLSLRYKDIVEVDNNNVRVNLIPKDLFNTTNFKAGPLLKLDFGRDESDSVDLTGLGNVSTSVELGVYASYAAGPLRYRVKFRKDVASGHSGTLADLDLSLALYRSDNAAYGARLSTTWASKRFTRAYFGVTADQATASGLTAYTPGGGIKDVSMTIGGEYRLTPSWAIIGNAGYSRLLGEVKKSPLVSTRGSANQFSAAMFAVYTF